MYRPYAKKRGSFMLCLILLEIILNCFYFNWIKLQQLCVILSYWFRIPINWAIFHLKGWHITLFPSQLVTECEYYLVFIFPFWLLRILFFSSSMLTSVVFCFFALGGAGSSGAINALSRRSWRRASASTCFFWCSCFFWSLSEDQLKIRS